MLRQHLEERNLTQVEFAAILGRPIQAVNEIISGKKAITPEMAHLIAKALNSSPDYWMDLEARYRLSLVRKNADIENVGRRSKLFQRAPVQELVRRGWLPRTQNLDLLERRLCELLELRSLDEQPPWAFQLRRSFAFEASHSALEAWLAIARRLALASKAKLGKFARSQLEQVAAELARMSPSLRTAPVMEQLRAVGILVVHVPHLPRTYVDGAVTWLDESSPLVVLSFRYRRVDNFWFTLMHELAHVARHTAQSFVDVKLVEDGQSNPQSQQETEADETASDWLIDRERFEHWISGKTLYSAQDVDTFAEKLRIHPGLVVGRLHHARKLPYTHLRRYLQPVNIDG